MEELNHTTVWFVIFAMAIGSFLIRFSFLGIIGDRQMPEWVLRHLRYTPVAVLPGLVAPLVFWPAATGEALIRREWELLWLRWLLGISAKTFWPQSCPGPRRCTGFCFYWDNAA